MDSIPQKATRKPSPESNAKRSATMKAKHGSYISPELRAQIGLKHRGKIVSAETRAKLSAARKGRVSPKKGNKPSANRTEKPCSTCKEIKPLIDFYKDKSHADGVSSNCKICTDARHKKAYQEERTHFLNNLAQQERSELAPQITFIYGLVDPETQEMRYIGKSNNPKQRYNAHLRETAKNDKTRWIAGLKSRGLKPTLQIIETVSFEEWEVRECYWIAFYQEQRCQLTNTRDGGGGMENINLEVARKISAKLKGRPSPLRGVKRPPYSEEWRANMSAAKKGKKHTLEARANMSKAHKGRIVSTETRKKLSESTKRYHQRRKAQGDSNI